MDKQRTQPSEWYAIVEMRREAQRTGDAELLALCERALDGDPERGWDEAAGAECARLRKIMEARPSWNLVELHREQHSRGLWLRRHPDGRIGFSSLYLEPSGKIAGYDVDSPEEWTWVPSTNDGDTVRAFELLESRVQEPGVLVRIQGSGAASLVLPRGVSIGTRWEYNELTQTADLMRAWNDLIEALRKVLNAKVTAPATA